MGEFGAVSPGDDVTALLTSARWLTAVNATLAGGGGGSQPPSPVLGDGGRQPVFCKIKNTTTGDIGRYGLLGVDAPLFDKTANEKYFLGPVLQFKGVKPKAEHAGRLAHCLGPIKQGAIGDAIIPCAVQCKVNIIDATHRHASIKDDDVVKLESGTSGTYPMVPGETGTGEKWAVIFLSGGGGAPASANLFLAKVTAGTTGYAAGGIKPAELTATTIKMYKGKGVRYTVKNVADPNQGEEGDFAEPELEDATSITWQLETVTGSAKHPAGGTPPDNPEVLTLINWVTTAIQVGDRVIIVELTTTKGRKRFFIIARDCG